MAADTKVFVRGKELAEQAAAKNEVTVERVIGELAKIAFGNRPYYMVGFATPIWSPQGLRL